MIDGNGSMEELEPKLQKLSDSLEVARKLMPDRLFGDVLKGLRASAATMRARDAETALQASFWLFLEAHHHNSRVSSSCETSTMSGQTVLQTSARFASLKNQSTLLLFVLVFTCFCLPSRVQG